MFAEGSYESDVYGDEWLDAALETEDIDEDDDFDPDYGWLDEYDDDLPDNEADAQTLRMAGWGTDEEYGYFGSEFDY